MSIKMLGMKGYICDRGQIKLIIGRYDIKKKKNAVDA